MNDKISQIKEMYGKIKNKTAFALAYAKVVDKSAMSLKNHWFSSFFSIPKEYQDQTVEYLKEYLRTKNY